MATDPKRRQAGRSRLAERAGQGVALSLRRLRHHAGPDALARGGLPGRRQSGPRGLAAAGGLRGQNHVRPRRVRDGRTSSRRRGASARTSSVNGALAGSIEVAYRESPTESAEPFLLEETKLINTIARWLGRSIEIETGRVAQSRSPSPAALRPRAGKPEWEVILDLLKETDAVLWRRILRRLMNHLSKLGVPGVQRLIMHFGPATYAERDRESRGANQPLPRDRCGQRHQAVRRDHPACVHRAARRRPGGAGEAVDPPGQARLPGDGHRAARPLARRVHRTRQPLLPVSTGGRGRAGAGRRPERSRDPGPPFPDRPAVLHWRGEGAPEHPRFRPAAEPRHRPAAGRRPARRQDRRPLPRRTHPEEEGPRQPSDRGHSGAARLVPHLRRAVRVRALQQPRGHPELQVPPRTRRCRESFPYLEQVFKHSFFPPDMLKDLKVALDDLGDWPLIVRSSSLLEDSEGSAFSGKYRSLFLPNTGSKDERLSALVDAIAEVYASVFGPDPIQYRKERGLLDFMEEMGILIQRVVGTRVGPVLPAGLRGRRVQPQRVPLVAANPARGRHDPARRRPGHARGGPRRRGLSRPAVPGTARPSRQRAARTRSCTTLSDTSTC